MRHFFVVATAVAALALPASAAAAPDLVVTASSVTPNPARPGDEVTLTWTVTNRGDAPNQSPLFTRLEAGGAGQWGIERVTCPEGAVQSKPLEECRLDGGLAPGASATTTFVGFSPSAESFDFRLFSYAADDPDHGNDAVSGRLVIEGPPVAPGGEGGAGGGTDLRLDDLDVSPARVKRGGRVKVSVRASGPCTLVTRLEKLTGGRWRAVPGTVKVNTDGGRVTFRLGPKLAGRALAPGRYRIEVEAVDADALRTTFTVVKR